MSFSESLNQCLRASIPATFLTLTFLATYLANCSQGGVHTAPHWFSHWRSNATDSAGDYTKNDLLIGSPDTFFWFLLPFFGLIAVGLCIAINYALLGIECLFTAAYARLRFSTSRHDDGRCVNSIFARLERLLTLTRRTPTSFAVTSTRQRVITTSVLLGLVSTVIPYQFAYVVLCIVGIATTVRALRVAWETVSSCPNER
jgi:GPI inositol-deacylase